MEKIVSYFFKIRRQPKEVAWFQTALYLFLLYKSITYAIHVKELFSKQSYIFHHRGFSGIYADMAFLLNNYYTPGIGIIAILFLGILALAGIAGKSNYVTKCLLWLLIVNFNYFLYPTLTAGDYLLNQLLFFNIFLNTNTHYKPLFNDAATALHNTALLAAKLQICLAYLMAAAFKLTDSAWLNGTAVDSVFQVPDYSNPFLQSLPYRITALATWLVLAYQLLFAVLIWFRPFKIYLLAFGILQHLIIAFGMGLFSFGIIMIICYILFLKYDYLSGKKLIISGNN